ncbi:MAG: hypothetical protein B7Y37_04505 [Sphingobacteriia bacterium 28-36-52]|nr:MAG: hypothetical protein B7Y37_04505 [Sphingobacteriia bacterium 28-36-52]
MLLIKFRAVNQKMQNLFIKIFFLVFLLLNYFNSVAQFDSAVSNKVHKIFRVSNQASYKLALDIWDSLYFNGGKNYMYHIAPIAKWQAFISSIDTNYILLDCIDPLNSWTRL